MSKLRFKIYGQRWAVKDKLDIFLPPNLSCSLSSMPHFQESIINYLAYYFFSLSLSSGLLLPIWKAMEKRLGVKPSSASWILSGFCWQTSVKWLRNLYLFYTCFCFSALWLSTGTIFFIDLRFLKGHFVFGLQFILKTSRRQKSSVLIDRNSLLVDTYLFCFGTKN